MVGAATEPAIPALLKPLLDNGFSSATLPLWVVPVAVIGLFAIRGIAGFVAQYGLAWAANRGMLDDARARCSSALLDAEPALFTRNTASSLTNTLTFEVQNGANQLVYSLQSLVRDSLTPGRAARLPALAQLAAHARSSPCCCPAVAFVMRTFSRRLHRLTVRGQHATDELAYVVEENVLAWRIVRLHGAGAVAGASASTRVSERAAPAVDEVGGRRRDDDADHAGAGACALSAVIVVALWQSSRGGSTVGGFVAFITAMLMLVRADQAPVRGRRRRSRAAWPRSSAAST